MWSASSCQQGWITATSFRLSPGSRIPELPRDSPPPTSESYGEHIPLPRLEHLLLVRKSAVVLAPSLNKQSRSLTAAAERCSLRWNAGQKVAAKARVSGQEQQRARGHAGGTVTFHSVPDNAKLVKRNSSQSAAPRSVSQRTAKSRGKKIK